jgi:hypothetical protein
MHLDDTNPRVWVRMGLCGSWDARGEGAVHWQALSTELFRDAQSAEAWRDWQTQVAKLVQPIAKKMGDTADSASVHLVVDRDGSILDASSYGGPERPYPDALNEKATIELIAELAKLKLPHFPTGSQVQQTHVLVYLSNKTGGANTLGDE